MHRKMASLFVPRTSPAGTLINGDAYRVPDAIGNKIFHPFGDFLLHDAGTGDGIVRAGPQDTANKLRTAPLWGLHIRSRLMQELGFAGTERRHSGGIKARPKASYPSMSRCRQPSSSNLLRLKFL
jgi:hypothetical protein